MSWVAGRQQRVNKLVGTGSRRHTLLKPLNNYEPPDSEGHEPLLHLQVESKTCECQGLHRKKRIREYSERVVQSCPEGPEGKGAVT